MFGKLIEKLLISTPFKIITIIGGVGGVKYGYDSIEDLMNKKTELIEKEEIDKIILTDEDKVIIQTLTKKKILKNEEMKEIKYQILKQRRQQKLRKKMKKFDIGFNSDLGENLNKDKNIKGNKNRD